MRARGDREWKRFRLCGPEGIFNIARSKNSIDAIRLVEDGEEVVPYVSRTDRNNGIARFVSRANLAQGYEKGGTITVGVDTQTAFYQPHNYVTGNSILVISGDRLTFLLAQFILPILRKKMAEKFNWGGNGATLSRVKRLEVMLPVDAAGNPDFDYMEGYIQRLIDRKYAQFGAFLKRTRE